jgi:hypothetical protein
MKTLWFGMEGFIEIKILSGMKESDTYASQTGKIYK